MVVSASFMTGILYLFCLPNPHLEWTRYPTNKSQYNDLQDLNMRKSRLQIPMMQTGECLHGVGSFKQSMFPQAIAMASSFDTDLVYRIGRAIGTEARSIGIHACFSPVLDLAKDPRWGRAQGNTAASLGLDSTDSSQRIMGRISFLRRI